MPTKEEREYCVKTASGEVILTDEQKSEILRKYDHILESYKLLLRIFLFGYEGRDDGLYEELELSVPKAEFMAATTDFRNSVLKGGMVRGLKSSVLGDRKPPKSTKTAQKPIERLREMGVLPIRTGLSSGDDFNLIEQVAQRIRSYIACDQSTRESYAAKKQRLADSKERYGQLDPEADKNEITKLGIGIEKLEASLSRLRPCAEFRLDEISHISYSVYLGKNYSPFEMEKSGNRIRFSISSSILAGEYELAYGDGQYGQRGLGKSKRQSGVPFDCEMPKKRRRNLLFDCTVEPMGDNYALRYMENGKRPRTAIIKQPRLYWRRVRGDVRLYLQMPLNIEIQRPEMFRGKEPLFKRYWPKEVDGLDDVTDLTILGVDLNESRAAACAALTASRFENGFPVDITVSAKNDKPFIFDERTDKGSEYKNLTTAASHLAYLIRSTRKYHIDQTPDNLERIQNAIWWSYFDEDAADSYIENMSKMSDDKTDIWQHAKVMPYGEWAEDTFSKFYRLKDERAHGQVDSGPSDDLAWCECIEAILSLKKSLHFGGFETKSRKGFCAALYRERRMVRDDIHKKLARFVVDAAVDCGASAIAIEDLSGKSSSSSYANRIWRLLAVSTWKNTLLNMAKGDGLGVISVVPEYTSQWVYGEGVIGHRPKNDSRHLYYLDADGNQKVVDADLNAALNIAHRALTRHAEPFHIDFRRVDSADGVRWEPKDACRPFRETKRRKGESDEKYEERCQKRKQAHEARKHRWNMILRRFWGDERPWEDVIAAANTKKKICRLYRHRDTLTHEKPRLNVEVDK